MNNFYSIPIYNFPNHFAPLLPILLKHKIKQKLLNSRICNVGINILTKYFTPANVILLSTNH
jgi:hypothetical protein